MEPFINQEKFRLRVLDNQLTFQDHLYSLRTPEGSHFEGMIEQFAGVFSEHMKQQMLSELSIKLAAKTQAVVYNVFKRVQANNRVGNYDTSSIFQNKYLSMICYIPGRTVGDSQEPGALSVEFDGTFHGLKTDRFYEELDRPEKQFSGQ